MDSRKPEPHEVGLLSSAQNMRDFMESSVWIDIRTWLEDRLEDLRNQLEGHEGIDEIRRMQGAAAQCRDLLNLPQALLDELETEVI